jgi:catechol 2,3-dioxygenase-like lactoylglutathione lyase family enzyme
MRVARPSNDFAALKRFYCDGLGLSLLGEFAGHDGFDGLIIGAKDAPYHLEFTKQQGVSPPRAPSEDMLLVFYLPEPARFHSALEQMRRAGAQEVAALNPYWAKVGVTFEDCDGYRVVLQNAAWR